MEDGKIPIQSLELQVSVGMMRGNSYFCHLEDGFFLFLS